MDGSNKYQIRPFRDADADDCLTLFRDTVHRVNCRDYTLDQLRAWAPVDLDAINWATRFARRFAYVATAADQVIGFTDMTADGHLDRLFVSADHQRQGIATHLVERVCVDARNLNIRTVTTEASITAKPFFERMGFVVAGEQSVQCRGVTLTNYKMRWDVVKTNLVHNE